MTRWAELTPRGAGGVSIVAVQGAGALDAVRDLAPGATITPGRPVLARLEHDGDWIDEALVVAHATDRVELQVHGAPPLVRRLARALGGGERRARAVGAPGREALEVGETSRREDDAGQRAIAWALLEEAACETAARTWLDQAEGALERELDRIAALDGAARAEAERALDQRSRRARLLITPPRLVLAGPVNAGKSTLFNALLGSGRAITSDEEGTTRDLLREPAVLGEWPVLLVDSAGERAGADKVERVGQRRGRSERARADLVLWLAPPSATAPPAADGERRVVVPSRGDLPGAAPDALRPLEDPAGARARIAAILREAFDLPESAWTPGAGVRLEESSGTALDPSV